MTVRHLDRLLRPRSVALIGASDRPQSLGALLLHNLVAGGFAGPLWPVNPKHRRLEGLEVYADVDALPAAPDLAVICTPARTVPGLISALGARGTKAAIVLGAGMKAPADPARPDGPTLEQAMLDAAKPQMLRILGPNCLGLLVPGIGLNASFAPAAAPAGGIAFLSQSGALATALLDWAASRGIGFSHFVSLGDSADVDFGDLLDELASDAGTRAILLYIESVKHARKFMSAARAAARNKPVLVVKAGRAPAGAKAAASHTGAMTGSDAVFDAAVRRAGLLRVATLDDLFDATETLARAKPLRGPRLALVTNGGGAGVLAADALALGGGTQAVLSAETLAALDACLPATWSHGNPVDLIGDAPVARYTDALRVLIEAPEVDALLFMHAPTAVVPSLDIARACIPPLHASAKPVLVSWLGGHTVAAAREACIAAGLPTYDTPERAVTAFLQLVDFRRNQDALLQTPSAALDDGSVDRNAARAILAAVRRDGRMLLNEPEAKALLATYGIGVVETRVVANADEARAASEQIGYPVVLKLLSPQVSHKSDVGGVVLDLRYGEAVHRAAIEMHARVEQLRPDAEIRGYTVQAMVQRPRAHELIVGVSTDAVFGPVMLFGQGGTAVEVVADRAIALPPLDAPLAEDLIARTRVAKLLAGYRDRAAADHDAIVLALLRVSQMVCDLPELAELDINPLLADEAGVIALDARVKLHPETPNPVDRMAIRPYPAELVSTIALAGRLLTLRPIRPEDEPLLRDFYERSTPEDLHLRFFSARRSVPHSELARYSQIDYDRELSLVAIDTMAEGGPALVGEVRALGDPDGQKAEFAVQVRSDWQRRRLGRQLMQTLLRHLDARGVQRVFGQCLRENEGMAELARSLGFTVRPSPDDSALCDMERRLAG